MTLVSEAEAVAEAVPVGEADKEAAVESVGRGLLVADGLADGNPAGVAEDAPVVVPEAVVVGADVAVALPVEVPEGGADDKAEPLGLAEAVEDPDELP